MKIIGYARVSSQEQLQGYSIQAQIDAIKRWAEREGHLAVRSGFECSWLRTDNTNPCVIYATILTSEQVIDRPVSLNYLGLQAFCLPEILTEAEA